MEQGKKIICLCIVCKRKQKDDIIASLQETGINMTNIVYGKGLVKAGLLQNLLGLVPEENKVVFFSMTTFAKSEIALKLLVDDFKFDQPNTGIAFTIPVEAVSY